MAAFEGCREPEKTRGFLCSLERMELVPGGFLGPLPPKGDPGSRGPMGMRGPAGHQLCAPRKPWSGRSCGYPWKEETSRAPRPSWPLWPPDLLDHPAPGSPSLRTRFCPALTETSSHWPPGPAGSPAPPGPRGPPGLPVPWHSWEPPGPTGPKEASGHPGEKSQRGLQGEPGPQGSMGAVGRAWPQRRPW